jgi:L-seryl-tRNA(Ser) seleniumtransferase
LERVYGRQHLRVQLRRWLDRQRGAAAEGAAPEAALAGLAADLERELAAATGGAPLARVLNATGIFLHTNLGRAPLPRAVAARLPELSDAACDLEYDLASGRRGERSGRVEGLVAALTGAEAALAVNNNSAALVLVLATLARGRAVLVSRGELVEIGGSFRVPEILEAAGARLVEVGTTNRTRLADYERALAPDTALLLKVLPSNFRQSGFVAEASPRELATLARRAGVPLLVDEGSGLLARSAHPQLAGHPSLGELLESGADLVCGSADKLAGGPQAGLLAGRRELVERCHRHPLYRALRPGRLVVAALELVLRRHLAGEAMPMDALWPDPQTHRARLAALAARWGGEIVAAEAFLGGGSAPEAPIAGEAIALAGGDGLAARLRAGHPPVVGYRQEGRLILDLRTVDPADDEALDAAVRSALAGAES